MAAPILTLQPVGGHVEVRNWTGMLTTFASVPPCTGKSQPKEIGGKKQCLNTRYKLEEEEKHKEGEEEEQEEGKEEKEEKKGVEEEEEEKEEKLSLLADNMILFLGNPKDCIKKSI
ncbi:DNA-directed RNA polymerase III subunit RPC7-like [Heterocephalus glaber]|uniref:DNA-directed RNA polymerase III subunit RPC7-like n=1 Tax=Heterocephalus glaber TaxID=10181 RepID=A0AAX6RRG9_HETGA|nr:DNA-directed RNA polymerase III subunit RPC7-like [Heterocephalus glaber]